MNKKEALDKFDPLRGSDAIYDFIERLYREGYKIVEQGIDEWLKPKHVGKRLC